jgi:hypothetical protein
MRILFDISLVVTTIPRLASHVTKISFARENRAIYHSAFSQSQLETERVWWKGPKP